jgi:hypothetical protein
MFFVHGIFIAGTAVVDTIVVPDGVVMVVVVPCVVVNIGVDVVGAVPEPVVNWWVVVKTGAEVDTTVDPVVAECVVTGTDAVVPWVVVVSSAGMQEMTEATSAEVFLVVVGVRRTTR